MKIIAFAAALCALAAPMLATAAMSPDPTGLWWVPAESGWGLSLVQQNDTVVAVLFVYDDAQSPTYYGQPPAWYIATLQNAGTGQFPPGFSGTLYRTSGPWFGDAFRPEYVTATAVGTMQIAYPSLQVQPDLGKEIKLNYTVNGIPVSKTVQPQTWGDGVASLLGIYTGVDLWGTGTRPGCPAPYDVFMKPTAFVVSDTQVPGELSITWGTPDATCIAHGAYTQRGRIGRLDGHLSCQPAGSPLSTDMTITMVNIETTDHGFTSSASIHRGACGYGGLFGGLRGLQ